MKKINLFLVLVIAAFASCMQPQKSHDNSKFADIPLEEISISEIQSGYSQGDFTITELVEAYIKRIKDIDESGPQLNSIIVINPDALKIAAKLDEELKQGKSRGSLHGIPVVLKDNIDTHDKMPTTAGSRALANSFPLQDSYVTKKLREAGAIIIGKANLSEWANFRGELSSSGWSGVGGQTKNPYVLSRNPCGSSSGSAVAVSANLTVLAIGTETNGSIVCPSNNNGIVGIKPTVGLLSRSGIIPISFTQDTPGPMARTLTDAVTCLNAICDVDSLDSKTLAAKGNIKPDYTKYLKKNGLEGKRIGVYTDANGINFKVDKVYEEAVMLIKSLGAEVFEIGSLENAEVDNNSFKLMLYEYKDGLNNYFESLGENAEIKSLQELIDFNNSDSIEMKYYNQKYLEMALKMSDLNSDDYKEALKNAMAGSQKNGIDRVMDSLNLDAIIAPTGGPAWQTDLVNGDNYQLGSSSPAAISGYPSITVPMGFIEELPIGISFFGRAWSEDVLIEVAFAYENATKYRRSPKFKVE